MIDHEKDSLDDTIGRNECPDGCVFKETDVDAGIHSGDDFFFLIQFE